MNLDKIDVALFLVLLGVLLTPPVYFICEHRKDMKALELGYVQVQNIGANGCHWEKPK